MKTTCIKMQFDGNRSYDIRVGANILQDLSKRISELSGVNTFTNLIILSDTTVAPLYAATVQNILEKGGFVVTLITIAAGEKSKDIAVATEIWNALAAKGADRNAIILALGGGVVGDLAGFVASTWMRGVAFVQLPTTLLAMVDSSVGGKTGIDLAAGKNLVGTFYQPRYVHCDMDLLDTLPKEQWQCGFAEIAKAAIISSADFYHWFAANAASVAARDDKDVLKQAIIRSLEFKGSVVVRDERESGLRECLNYGHTFAHALEKVCGYQGITHGRAVAEGIRFAARLATEAIGASSEFAAMQEDLLGVLGLDAPLSLQRFVSADDLFAALYADKKVSNGELRFVLASAPGDWQLVPVDPDLVKIYLLYWEQAQMSGE